MGIYGHQFYFKERLPDTAELEKKFHEITGLDLSYHVVAYIDELVTDEDDILYHIRKKMDETNYVVLQNPRFFCKGFDYIYLSDYMRPETRAFYIECDIGTESMYFFFALIKTFLELGGYTLNHSYYPPQEDLDIDQYLEPYHPYERKWKRIKKWTEMSDWEKAAFKGKYS